MTRSRITTRRGAVYLLVLLTAAFVLATGLAALTLEDRTHQRADLHAQVAASRNAARAGLDLALEHIRTNDGWRNDAGPDGLIYQNMFESDGEAVTLTAYAVDPDGSLYEGSSVGTTDPFELSIEATIGDAVGRVTVLVEPQPMPMDVLELGAYSHDKIEFYGSCTITGDGDWGSRNDITGSGSTLEASVVCCGTIEGLSVGGISTSCDRERELPGNDLYRTYQAIGTNASMLLVPRSGGRYFIQNVAIGPGLNPYGLAGNSNGVYIFDQGSDPITVRNARVVGTLVFIGGGTVTLEGSLNMQPANPGWPAVITREDLVLNTSNAPLVESGLFTNFNPIGLDGLLPGDLDTFDTYESAITGIVFCGDVLFCVGGDLDLTGSLIAVDDFQITGGWTADINRDYSAGSEPPPGFESSQTRMAPLEWRTP